MVAVTRYDRVWGAFFKGTTGMATDTGRGLRLATVEGRARAETERVRGGKRKVSKNNAMDMMVGFVNSHLGPERMDSRPDSASGKRAICISRIKTPFRYGKRL
ncbi:hypothetical protein GCM10011378_12020 [Hymenobacter glacieicola]|uniref:Uncharacterized protein n=1 Tax=Hymenobacter glacieicola TaxID=1562124 RepID=A0ABQ1WME7_9BACT|nr:hypothetical protein GCM10011378_12020 [Hymenobacter glacieicola]